MVRNMRTKAADVGKHFGVKQRTIELVLQKISEIRKILADKPHLATHNAHRDSHLAEVRIFELMPPYFTRLQRPFPPILPL